MRILLLAPDTMLGPVLELCLRNFGYNDVINISNNPKDKLFYDPEHNVYEIKNIINKTQPDIVINCLATLISESEQNHPKAVLVNSFLPHYLNSLSKEHHFKLIHRSTDCVFEGTLGDYTETSPLDATNFYGRTKALGEINNNYSLTLRVSLIGPDTNPNGESLFSWFMRQPEKVQGYSKVYWTGITTVEFAKIVDLSIKNQLVGLYNISNGEKITKSDLLRLFAEYYKPTTTIIDNPSKHSDKSLAKNPNFNFAIPSYDKMISNMYEWTNSYIKLYPFLQERN
ncbi:MAG: sugar nucleotide-binding protein [Candidatus Saccharibacteria bacterium]|nr:sugar nucleotide-binding protein [Candidatus Saccharibacteria bacterium]